MKDTYWRARLVAHWPVYRTAVTPPAMRDLTLDLYIPEVECRGVVVYIHGGGWETGTNDRPPGFRTVLSRGYALSAVQYRFATEVAGQTIVDDIRAALAATRELAYSEKLSTRRWYLWGVSAGGHLASLVAHETVRRPRSGEPTIGAVASWCGPMDLEAYGRLTDVGAAEVETVRRIVRQLTGGAAERARSLSPITYAGPDSAPHLFVHGRRDRLVPPSQSEAMHRALRTAGVRTDLLLIPDGAHAMPPGDSPEMGATLAFFDSVAAAASTAQREASPAEAPRGDRS